MAYNSVIRADDPQAAAKLKENIENFESRQEYMQKVNDYYKEHGTVYGCPGIDDKTAEELDSRVNEYQSTPYPGRFFKENYLEINRLKSNITRLTNNKDSVFKGWQFEIFSAFALQKSADGCPPFLAARGEAVINLANNRLQLMFKEIPDNEQREVLKQSGFKWAPTAKAWQRPLDFKTMAAVDKIDFVKPIDGRKPSELQPKMPKRNTSER